MRRPADHEQVRALQIAVHNLMYVRRLEHLGDLRGQRQLLVHGQAAAPEAPQRAVDDDLGAAVSGGTGVACQGCARAWRSSGSSCA